jgi:hypothetical protein
VSETLDALVHALCESDGFPVPTEREFAARVLEQLDRIGYDLVKRPGTGTVYGIRPHLPRTSEEDALERRLAEDMLRTTPAAIPPELLP